MFRGRILSLALPTNYEGPQRRPRSGAGLGGPFALDADHVHQHLGRAARGRRWPLVDCRGPSPPPSGHPKLSLQPPPGCQVVVWHDPVLRAAVAGCRGGLLARLRQRTLFGRAVGRGRRPPNSRGCTPMRTISASREHAGNRDHAVVLGTSIAGPPSPVAPRRFRLRAGAVPARGWCYSTYTWTKTAPGAASAAPGGIPALHARRVAHYA
jgi:hypothetical protein